MPRARRRVFVIGLDSAAPQLVFDLWRDDLPNLKGLMDGGTWGELISITPPITIPAWACMMVSKDPGQLGVYGFRNRADYAYERMIIANSNTIREQAVWDILGQAGRDSILVGVPPTYPPKPIRGHLVSCLLTPSTRGPYTYPEELRNDIDNLVGEYVVDVAGFRAEDKEGLVRQIYEMTDKRFQVLRYLLREKPWDFFMFVEIGLDRIHHAFWRFMDPAHPKYQPGSAYQHVIRDYYRYLDRELGTLLELLDDNTVVLVVSDHGAKKMDGGICVNEWLRREGYLVLKEEPRGIVPLQRAAVDWARTKAWGEGGYYGRLCLNVKGREPQGIIPIGEYEAVRDELVAKLEAITDENGRNIGTRALKPQTIYRECQNIPPDLIVTFGNLNWRSVGSLGLNSTYAYENDVGQDDANHAQEGLFILYDPSQRERGRVGPAQLVDIAPTVLALMGFPVPSDMIGQIIG